MNVGLCNRIYVDYEVDNPVRPVSRAEQRMFMEQTGSVAYVICGLAWRHAHIQGSIQTFLHSLEDEFLGNFDHIQVSPAVVVYENGGVVYAMVTLTGVGASTAAQALCGTFTDDENNPIPHPNDPGGLAAIRQFGCRTIRMQYGREQYHPTTEEVVLPLFTWIVNVFQQFVLPSLPVALFAFFLHREQRRITAAAAAAAAAAPQAGFVHPAAAAAAAAPAAPESAAPAHAAAGPAPPQTSIPPPPGPAAAPAAAAPAPNAPHPLGPRAPAGRGGFIPPRQGPRPPPPPPQ